MSEKLITLSNLATFKEQIENEIGSSTGLPDTTPVIALTSSSITLTFNEGVLPTHLKLSNGVIVDLQGNEYCAEGNETVSQSISNGKIVIVVNGDFSELASVTMTNLIWTLISNTTNFSFNDLPRFSDSSDVADFPGSSGGEGSGGSGKLYEYDFTLSTNQLSSTFDIKLLIYESNFERFKTVANGLGIQINTPQDLRDFINNTYTSSSSGSKQKNDMFGALINNCDLKYEIITVGGRMFPNQIIGADLLSVYGVMASPIFDLYTDSGGEDVYYTLDVNNSCTLTEYGTSASGGSSSGSGGSGKLYEFRFNATQYDMSGNQHEWNAVSSYIGTTATLTFSVSIYESNFEMFKQAMAVLSSAYNIQISCDTPQDFVDYINSTFIETSAVSTNVAGVILCAMPIFADKVLITNANQTTVPYRVVGQLHLFAITLGLVTSDGIVGIAMQDFDQQTSAEPLFGINANNSCTLTEYGTSASGGDTPSSESSYDYVQMCFNNSNNSHIIVMFDKQSSRRADMVTQVNQLITTLNQMGNVSIPAYTDLEDLADIADYLNALDTQTYAQIKVVFWANVLHAYTYLCLSIKGYNNGMVVPVIVEGIADMSNQNFAYTIKMMDNTGAMVTEATEQTVFDFDIFVNDLD